MGLNYIRLCFLLFLINGSSSLNTYKNQWTFSYNGNVSTYSSISNDIVSLWGVYATLTIQKVEQFAVAKLDNIKTIAYNGQQSEIPQLTPLAAPVEAAVLSKPFTIHYDGQFVTGISHQPDDVIWSINFKKSIASMFQIDEDAPETIKENHIYGSCNTHYTADKLKNTIVIHKSIDFESCSGNFTTVWQNFQSPICVEGIADSLVRNITRDYIVKKIDSGWVIKNVRSYSMITFKTMPGELIYSYMEQEQTFDLIAVNNYEKKIDLTKNTVKTPIAIEQTGEDQGRNMAVTKKTKEEQIAEWYKAATKLKEEFNSNNLSNINVETYNDYSDVLYELMDNMNYDTLMDLHTRVTHDKHNKFADIFTSLLPIIGNDNTLKFIEEFFKKDLYNDIAAIRILTTFPIYTNIPSEEMLTQMEFLMDLKHISSSIVRDTGILSFAHLVSDTYNSGKCSKEVYDGYVKKYFKLFMDSDKYGTRLVYLQGLFNLEVDVSYLVPLIRNNKEPHHLRSLAIYAVKEQMNSDPEKAFKMFWPMVKDKSLKLDIRVAALDIILEGTPTREQFMTILQTIKFDDDLDNRHLYNYLYTTFSSVRNETKCMDHLSDFMDLEMEEPQSETVWLTGKYRQGYTESSANHGLVVEAQLVGDPITNVINSAHVKFDRWAMSLNAGSFSVYIKMEGVADFVFSQYMNSLSSVKSVPELLSILQRTKLEVKDPQNLHLEIIVYSYGKAIFVSHLTPENASQYRDLLKTLLTQYESFDVIKYPLVDYIYTTSDLGTLVATTIEVKTLFTQNLKEAIMTLMKKLGHENTIRMKNTWLSDVTLKSYNPIDDIKFGVSKLHKSDQLLSFAYKYDAENTMLSWKADADTQFFSSVTDQFVATYVSDLEYLNNHCADCANIFLVTNETQEEDTNNTYDLPPFSTVLAIATSSCTKVSNYQDQYRSGMPDNIYDGFPLAIPYMLVSYFSDFTLYSVPMESCSLNVQLKSGSVPTESSLQFIFDSANYHETNVPLDGSDSNFTVAFTQKNAKGELLNFWNVSTAMMVDPGESHQKFSMRFNTIDTDGTKNRFCLDSEVKYPERDVDLFSMHPIGPTNSKVTIRWGSHDLQSATCPTEMHIEVTTAFSVIDEQKKLAEKASIEPFKTCKKDSMNLKYTAPTEACLQATKKMSTYRDYFMNIHIIQAPEWLESGLETAQFYINLFNDDNVTVEDLHSINMSAKFYVAEPIVVFGLNNEVLSMDLEHAALVEMLLMSPETHILNDEMVNIGLESTCIITPNFVKTFTGKVIKNYEPNTSIDKVGYIDCTEDSKFGLTFKKVDDRQMAFKLWSHEEKLLVSPKTQGVNVILNNVALNKTNVEDVSVNFLKDDVIFVENNLQHIYYNKEYIYVNVYSVHLKSMCGICSPQEDNVSV